MELDELLHELVERITGDESPYRRALRLGSVAIWERHAENTRTVEAAKCAAWNMAHPVGTTVRSISAPRWGTYATERPAEAGRLYFQGTHLPLSDIEVVPTTPEAAHAGE